MSLGDLNPVDAQLVGALLALAKAENPDAARRVLEQHPEMLNERVEHLLSRLITNADRRGDSQGVAALERLGKFLKRLREGDPSEPPDELVEAQAASLPAELGLLLQKAAETTQDISTFDSKDLDRAVSAWARVLQHSDFSAAPEPFRSQTLNYAASVLLRRYWVTGDPTNLDTSIKLWRRAVETSPSNSSAHSTYRANLGIALHEYYARSGELEILEEAIAIFREALVRAPKASLDWLSNLNNLAIALRTRYIHRGDLQDLEEAVGLFEEALARTPVSSPERSGRLNNLGLSLQDRYARIADLADLERAISAFAQAVESTPFPADRLTSLNNLAISLRARYDHSGNPADLERAISAFEQAVESTPPDSPDAPGRLNNLGIGLRARYDHSGNPADLERAISAFEQAVESTPPDSPDAPGRLNNLGIGLRARYDHSGNPADLERAISAYRRSLQSTRGVGAEAELAAAINWGSWAASRGSWNEAAEAYRAALPTVNSLLRTQMTQKQKQIVLHEARGLSPRAAFAFAKVGDTEGATVTLEMGRALLLSEGLVGSFQLDDLTRSGHGELVERYRRASARVSDSTRLKTEDGNLREAIHSSAELRGPRTELEAAIAAIRQIPGYERFLDAPNFADVRTAAAHSPLVYLASSELGGLALIIGPAGDPTTVWLPELTETALHIRMAAIARDYRRDQAAWRGSFDAVTAWLWPAVMGPVLDALGVVRHAVFIPVGLLGLLPLHAAWKVDDTTATGRRYVLDTIAVSYSPNARALVVAVEGASKVPGSTILAVSDPRPVSADPLPLAEPEAAAAASHFTTRTILQGRAAVRAQILRDMSTHEVLHFACRGYGITADPLDSALVFADDELLTLYDLLNLRLGGIRLAVLSASETAFVGNELPDEVLNLPTGFIHAGAAGVVAPQWMVSGLGAALLMTRFYEYWKLEGFTVEQALRAAQLWMRETTNSEKLAFFRTDEGQSRLLLDANRVLRRELLRRPGDERSFAHPTEWAAFTHVGA